MPRSDPVWEIWIDTGGTFTDGVAAAPDGTEHHVKILSSGALRGRLLEGTDRRRFAVEVGWSAPPGLVDGWTFRLLRGTHRVLTVETYDPGTRTLTLSGPLDRATARGEAFELVADVPAPVVAARLLTGTGSSDPLPSCRMRLATTLGTNTLLERAGVRTALFITRGFGDLLRIGNQQRPDLFVLDVRRPEMLYDTLVEVPERLDAGGAVIEPLDPGAIEPRARELVAQGLRVAAVALLHAYRNPVHELELERFLYGWGFERVCRAGELAARIKLLPRAETTVVDSYLAPVVAAYLEGIGESVNQCELLVMTSAGGLLAPADYRPRDSLLSGPAGGVVGAARAGRRSGCQRVIGFDMGGTSTDVARYDGDFEYVYEHRVGDAHLMAPALAIESVAAGGGSICWLDGERLRVGPRSTGADPGPACYGAGGPLTLTDVNLLCGRIDPERFEIPIQGAPACDRLDDLRRELAGATGESVAEEALLEGLLSIANETMADAIRTISLRRGYDPADYALLAFGGAGAQHACAVAGQLGIGRVIVPADAALLSATGLGHAVLERFVERQVLQPLSEALRDVPRWLEEMSGQAIDSVCATGFPRERITIRRRILDLRFAGQDATVQVEWSDPDRIAEAFEERYVRLFGHRPERRPVELESLRVVASSVPGSDRQREPREPDAPAHPAAPDSSRRLLCREGWLELPVFDRDRLACGAFHDGPGLVLEGRSATVVEPGWGFRVDGAGALVVERQPANVAATVPGGATAAGPERPEAIRLELFTQRFHTLVRDMGQRLEQTAVSTNVKERLDFSCALLNPRGELVVNAPHIPVHLGALGLCVRRVREALPLRHGDVVVTNHPAFGGSHLPDVTVITPVFNDADDGAEARLLGYVASRAHHAEIGGSRPGSMPPDARTLAEEGIVIPPAYLVEQGVPRWNEMRRLLLGGKHPSRSVEDNLSDLRAAVAANHHGAESLRDLARAHGEGVVAGYMEQLEALAERRIREALRSRPDGAYEAIERLDDGSPLRARIEIEGDRARIDFAGSADVHAGNLNATPAIVQSAVLYVLRLLLRQPLPLNEGLLRAVIIELPPGLLNPPFDEDPKRAPAVVGGNVETSQRLVDTLLRALSLCACSQGTMNNVIFGNSDYGYYETIGGGTGAGPGFHGASGVHSHMTNTRITDPEILEHRHPVRLERFALRPGSGGAGRFHGGDGLVRELTFLQAASVSVLTQHRVEAPYGLAGGKPGARGRQTVVRSSGETFELRSIDGCQVDAGDRLIIETPGGGGYGRPEAEPS